MHLSSEQLQALDQGEVVPFIIDGRECVVLRREMYERVRTVVPNDVPSIEEQRYMLREIGKMAGWDDPDMDVYDQ